MIKKDEQREYGEEMKTDCFKWDGDYSSIEQGILWYSSKKRYLYSNGFVVLSEKTLNMASRIIQILFKMGCREVLKNVKGYFWWRSIWIESFERKCIRSYALNWGYFSVWCDGNWRINGVIKCFNWIELFFVLFLFTGTKNMARLP